MTRKIIDLSLTFNNTMRGVDIQSALRINPDGYNTSNVTLYSHAGTHMDAPKHFINGGGSIDDLDLDKCIGDALLIDLTHKAPNSFITVDDLSDYAGRITAGSRVILRTDWDKHVGNADYRTHFPRISVELAAWLAERGVWLLGVQSPSVASLVEENRQELTDVHQTLLAADIVIVEGLANLDQIAVDTFTFIALPLKLEHCDGSPTRPIAIVEG